MPAEIPASHADLFQKKSIAHLAVNFSDGRTLVNPVWCELADGHVQISSVEGRLKDRLMRADPRVTLCLSDPENPYRYMEVRGRVVEMTQTGGRELIDRLAKRYMGVDAYPNDPPGTPRVVYRIQPDKIVAFPFER